MEKQQTNVHQMYKTLERAHLKFLKFDGQLLLLQRKRDGAYREWVEAKDKIRFIKQEEAPVMQPFPDMPDSVTKIPHLSSGAVA